jgi:hypothetical protein
MFLAALRHNGERRGDLDTAEQALAQITAAFETFRDAHHAPNAAYIQSAAARRSGFG